MFFNDDPTSIAVRPVATPVGTPGYFTDGNPGLGQAATIVQNDFLNTVQDELMNLVLAAGLAPNKFNNAQVLQALRQIIAGRNFRLIYTSANFVVPPGVVAVRATVVGAGGSGGGTTSCTATQISVAAGGNSGTIGVGNVLNLVPGASIAVTVGLGGQWLGGANATSSPGGSSSFGPYISAPGGNGPGFNVPANPPPLIQSGYPTVAQAAGGFINSYESVGRPSLGIGALNFLSGAGGNCGIYGAGGDPVASTSANGNGALGFGSGGSGGATGPSATAKAGGAGAQGMVLVEW